MYTGMPRKKDQEIRIRPAVDMLRMDEPLLNLDELVRPVRFLPHPGIEHLLDMVPYIHSRLVLPGVNQRNFHYPIVVFITIKGVPVQDE
jgi:hypothetical protein